MTRSKEKGVKLILDLSKPLKMTKAQREQMARLKRMTDDEIDYSDIPELDDEFWANAKRVPIEERLRLCRLENAERKKE